MKRALYFALLSLLTALIPLLMSGVALATENKSHPAIDPDDAYKTNCMRCHVALPQSSPRMTRTIMMHMRVVANLPADEAHAILEYLQPAPADSEKPGKKQSELQPNQPTEK